MEGILNLENWRKFGNDWVGYYVYPIASKVAYKIVINFHYKNQYIKVKVNEKYFHIGKSYRFTSIKDMKNIINKIEEYIYMYINDAPHSNLEFYKNTSNCSIFYISINKIITKWLINNICYYIHINRTKNAHLRIYK